MATDGEEGNDEDTEEGEAAMGEENDKRLATKKEVKEKIMTGER